MIFAVTANGRTVTGMDKKDAVINALREYWRAFENAERVDLAPVVRCKDCKYSHMTVNGECKYCDIWFPDEAEYTDGDYYCASGEQRDGEQA